MLKTLFLTVAATLVTALPAAAESWVFVTRSESGTEYFIDTESVQGRDGIYLFWRMSVLAKPNEQGILAQKTYVSMICPLRAWRQQAIAYFNTRGELVSREEFGEREPLQFFTFGSVGEGLWKFVCQ